VRLNTEKEVLTQILTWRNNVWKWSQRIWVKIKILQVFSEILEKTEENVFFNSVVTCDDKIWLFQTPIKQVLINVCSIFLKNENWILFVLCTLHNITSNTSWTGKKSLRTGSDLWPTFRKTRACYIHKRTPFIIPIKCTFLISTYIKRTSPTCCGTYVQSSGGKTMPVIKIQMLLRSSYL